MNYRSLFDEGKEEVPREPGEEERCTPERLLAFINESRKARGRPTTLEECKDKFGGILGPLVDAWALRERGLI